MTIRFDDRVAVITGAGNGLGRAHALMLAERGAAIVVNDIGGAVDGTGTSHSAADAVVADIAGLGGSAIANYDSVADRAGAEAMIAAAIERFGKVDILVNNAGILRDKTFGKMPLEDFRQVLEIHLMGSVHCTKAAWPHMRERNFGRVVMTSSGAGIYGNFGQSNYGTAKMALVGLMNVLKLEGARDGILVNTVAPIAATRMTAALMPERALPHLKSEYVSAMVAYFCSEECRVSGELISVGAGYLAKAQVVEAEGVFLDGDEPADPDRIAALFGKICDMTDATGFRSAEEYTAKAFARFLEESEAAR